MYRFQKCNINQHYISWVFPLEIPFCDFQSDYINIHVWVFLYIPTLENIKQKN